MSTDVPEVIVRFAPSPTGRLHVGNARTALFNWLFARRAGGKFMLRLDDTDDERSTEEYAHGIVEDLGWLGLVHDILDRQSNRMAEYDAAAERLKAQGLLYPCYETPEELEMKRKMQARRGLPPVYDRAALSLTDDDRKKLEAEGRRPHWRFKLDREVTAFVDLIFGETKVDCASVSDPVLIRADGRYLYTLPSVVDDIDFGITHIIRGADHVTNTGVQVQLFRALGGTPPVFAHHSMLQGPEGKPLSKRDDAADYSLMALREHGIEPMSLNALLARLGTPDPVEATLSLDHLAEGFDATRLGRSDIRFDLGELEKVNAATLHLMEYGDVKERLQALDCDLGPDFWEAVRPNLIRFAEAKDWARIAEGPVTPVIEDTGFAAKAADLLPEGGWDGTTWKAWTDAVKAETGAKGKGLFMPLRLALTGLDHGPELKNLLPLIGRERAKARLRGETA